jgi:ubiquinone biosynthesis protein
MMLEAFHIDPQDLVDIVPDCYAEFRPVVADGLTFFLEQLSPARFAEVFQAQAKLPADAKLPHRLMHFLHACPALHKIGQVIARNRYLDIELRKHLQELESVEPYTSIEDLQPLLAREIGPTGDRYRIRMAKRQLAEGSVAVVMPLTWPEPADGTNASCRQGVAKVLKPGIRQRLDEDLRILARLAGHLEDRWAAYGLPPLAYQEILAEVAELLAHEIELQREQVHLERAASQFRGRSDVQIPKLLPFCTSAVTAMERVYGCKITDVTPPGSWQKPALFCSTIRALLSDVLFSRDETVLYHGDPHAGNLIATRCGRLAILDWSLAGHLTTHDRVQFARIIIGAWTMDGGKVATACANLAAGANADLIRRNVTATLAAIARQRPPGPIWAMNLLDELARAGVRFPARLLLFRKAFLTLQGVLSDVCPHGSLEATLVVKALVEFAWEWPLRWCKPLESRDWATHVSSVELLSLFCRAAYLAL